MIRNNITLIYFFPTAIRASRRELFQLERLEREGYNIIVLDASQYYDKELSVPSKPIHENTFKCTSKADCLDLMSTIPKGNTAIFITSDLYVKTISPILKAIIRKNDVLLAYKTKEFSNKDFTTNKIKLFVEHVIKKADKLIDLSFIRFYYQLKYKLCIPDYYLFSTKYIIPLKVYLTVKKSNRIVVHTDDINQVINIDDLSIMKDKNYGVFLDQAIPFVEETHPVLCPPGYLPDNYLNTYYDNVEKILKHYKNILKLDEVVIAMHPSSVFFKEKLKGKLSSFKQFVGITPNLIKNANIVFGHYSASMAYGIYYKKPVIILKDEFLMTDKLIKKNMLFFINELGMKNIYMDRELEDINHSEIKIDKDKYLKYTLEFLKDNDIQENSYYYAIKKITDDLIGREA